MTTRSYVTAYYHYLLLLKDKLRYCRQELTIFGVAHFFERRPLSQFAPEGVWESPNPITNRTFRPRLGLKLRVAFSFCLSKAFLPIPSRQNPIAINTQFAKMKHDSHRDTNAL